MLRYSTIQFLDSCQPYKWGVKSATQTVGRQGSNVSQTREGSSFRHTDETPNPLFLVWLELDPRLSDGLSGGLPCDIMLYINTYRLSTQIWQSLQWCDLGGWNCSQALHHLHDNTFSSSLYFRASTMSSSFPPNLNTRCWLAASFPWASFSGVL